MRWLLALAERRMVQAVQETDIWRPGRLARRSSELPVDVSICADPDGAPWVRFHRVPPLAFLQKLVRSRIRLQRKDTNQVKKEAEMRNKDMLALICVSHFTCCEFARKKSAS